MALAKSPELPLPGSGTWAHSSLQVGKDKSFRTVTCEELIACLEPLWRQKTWSLFLRGPGHGSVTTLATATAQGHFCGSPFSFSPTICVYVNQAAIQPSHLSPRTCRVQGSGPHASHRKPSSSLIRKGGRDAPGTPTRRGRRDQRHQGKGRRRSAVCTAKLRHCPALTGRDVCRGTAHAACVPRARRFASAACGTRCLVLVAPLPRAGEGVHSPRLPAGRCFLSSWRRLPGPRCQESPPDAPRGAPVPVPSPLPSCPCPRWTSVPLDVSGRAAGGVRFSIPGPTTVR